MIHSEFEINKNFYFYTQECRCTDKGTRIINMIRLDKNDSSYYNGPPYSIPEILLDETDFEVCYTSLEEAKKDWL